MSKDSDTNIATMTGAMYVSVTNEGGFVSYSVDPLRKWKPVAGERLLTHSFLMDSYRKIMGRTLTLLDASIHEAQQNKAMKDIVRNIFSDEMGFAAEWAFDQGELQQKFVPVDIDPKELGTVSVEEALGVDEKSN